MGFNAKVDEVLAQAESNVVDITPSPFTTPAHQRILKTIRKGQSLLEECQKLIRLADHSDHGADEYKADNLAKDSDDNKRIEKAERPTEHKVGKWCEKRSIVSVAGKPLCFPTTRFPLVAMGSSRFDSTVPPAFPPDEAPGGTLSTQAYWAMSLLHRDGPLAPLLPHKSSGRKQEVVSISKQ